MEIERKTTKPKPFVFVLMPFDSSVDDTYKFGIKGAAEDGASETLKLFFIVWPKEEPSAGNEPMRLRIHTHYLVCDYRFKLAFQESQPSS